MKTPMLMLLSWFALVGGARGDCLFDCGVKCPSRYGGACVKSRDGCFCSCQESEKDLRKDIESLLQKAGAEDKEARQWGETAFVERSTKGLAEVEFTSRKGGKEFRVIFGSGGRDDKYRWNKQ